MFNILHTQKWSGVFTNLAATVVQTAAERMALAPHKITVAEIWGTNAPLMALTHHLLHLRLLIKQLAGRNNPHKFSQNDAKKANIYTT
jgi:hypothetical protein